MPKNKMPIRCFEGTAQPHQPFWTVKNSADEDEIEFYGFISEYSWFDDDITPKLFAQELEKLQGRPLTLRINSGGGDVIAASVIRAMLADYPGQVTARIDGLCASAATMVALAADKITMQDSAFFMIHDPGFSVMFATLDIDFMQGMLDTLKTVKGSLIDLYETRTGISRERLSSMMRNETWLSASEAVKLGFADESLSGGKAAVTKEQVDNVIKNFVNVPAALLNAAQPVDTANIEQARRLRDEVQILK